MKERFHRTWEIGHRHQTRMFSCHIAVKAAISPPESGRLLSLRSMRRCDFRMRDDACLISPFSAIFLARDNENTWPGIQRAEAPFYHSELVRPMYQIRSGLQDFGAPPPVRLPGLAVPVWPGRRRLRHHQAGRSFRVGELARVETPKFKLAQPSARHPGWLSLTDGDKAEVQRQRRGRRRLGRHRDSRPGSTVTGLGT
jgi:hypothetical protein